MPNKASKGYSYLIKPLLVVVDIIILCVSAYFFLRRSTDSLFYVYLSVGWLASSVWIRFYGVYRFTQVEKIIRLLIKQGFLLTFVLYSYFGIVRSRVMSAFETVLFVAVTIIAVGVIKLGIYYLLKNYRLYFGGNNRQVLIFGSAAQTDDLVRYFQNNPDLGYHIHEIFDNALVKNIDVGISYLKENRIDEVYCAIQETSDQQINEVVNYCAKQGIVLKFIPNVEKVPISKLHTDYYDYFPVLSMPKFPLHNPVNVIVKRFLDIIISLFVIVVILSWLTPLLYVILRLEGKGPLFYVHKRNGVNYEEFLCYKFRSLCVEGDENRLHVSEEDDRVTKIGRFLRKTSIDEIPQFYNVLKGDMSVVGPRPHIPRYTHAYAKKIDKYQFVFRHSVRPGITGLAQIKGYRGEVKSDEDIINRIKYDVFYIENWSTVLDIKIMLDTFIILLKGQKKAY